jgi:acetyl esterase
LFSRDFCEKPVPTFSHHALVTAGVDPIRDSGRVYVAELVRAGVAMAFIEFAGVIHGFVQLRKPIPSAQADIATIFAAIRQQLERS